MYIPFFLPIAGGRLLFLWMAQMLGCSLVAQSHKEALFPKMIWVEGGQFQMGCTSEQIGYKGDERPVHEVELDGFYMSESEVTVAQFYAFIQETSYSTDSELGIGYYGGGSFIRLGDGEVYKERINWRMDERGQERSLEGAHYPVLHVSWRDATAYTAWLTQKMGVPYRLPTEAEWEYAARGGKHSQGYRYAGSHVVEEVAWYWDNAGRVHPVKEKQPNELGLYDMSGNVQEWCLDWYGPYTNTAQTNPMGPEAGTLKVYRGGSWNRDSDLARCSRRISRVPTGRSYHLGFRVVQLGSAPGN